jgi:hypothetical protein
MRNMLLNLLAAGALAASVACIAKEQAATRGSEPSATPLSKSPEAETSWPSDPTSPVSFVVKPGEGIKRAWGDFERTQQYRLARPSDRRLTPAARARVNSNNPNQIVPFLTWWGVRGLTGGEGKDVLVAIVVDPTRSDNNRYGLVVIASPKSEKGAYKVYVAAREEDMESYLISPASGSIYIECFRRDGSEETKELVWDRESKRFRLD